MIARKESSVLTQPNQTNTNTVSNLLHAEISGIHSTTWRGGRQSVVQQAAASLVQLGSVFLQLMGRVHSWCYTGSMMLVKAHYLSASMESIQAVDMDWKYTVSLRENKLLQYLCNSLRHTIIPVESFFFLVFW